MKLENLSARTIDVFTARVATFARHVGWSPQDLRRDGVRAYSLDLAQITKVSWSAYYQALAALQFLG